MASTKWVWGKGTQGAQPHSERKGSRGIRCVHVASAAHRTAHLLEALDVPDQVVQRVDALLHREGELVVDGAQEVGDVARGNEVGGACGVARRSAPERRVNRGIGGSIDAVGSPPPTTTTSTITPTPARARRYCSPLMPRE